VGIVTLLQNNFTAGELSPRLFLRSDLAKYANGLSSCENMIPQPHGGLTRRTGTAFAAPAVSDDTESRLLPFVFSQDVNQSYALEFGDNVIRIFKDDGQVRFSGLSVSGITNANPALVTIPAHGYSNGDTVYIDGVEGMTEINNKWYEIANTTANTFELVGVDSTTFGAYTSGGTSEKVVEVVSPYSASELAQITFRQSADVLYLVHPNYIERQLTRSSDTSWTLVPTEFINGPYLDENVTDTTLTPSGTDGSVTVTASSTVGINGGSGFVPTDVGREIRWFNDSTYFWLTITAYTSSTEVTATFNDGPSTDTTATDQWSLGAWSDTTGYPSKTVFFENRAFFANTDAEPATVWASAVNGYNDFEPDVEDDDALTFTLGGQLNEIKWMNALRDLRIGTQGVEWTVGYSDRGLTPTQSVNARERTYHGSNDVQAVGAGGATMFVQRTGKIVRELIYSFELDNLIGNDITILSEHITGFGITEMFYSPEPDSILWLVRSDGVLLSLTYNRSQDVVAWSRHTFSGEDPFIDSITSIPNVTQDRVWVSVVRTINGERKRYIEYITDQFKDKTVEEAVFVDSSRTFTGETPAVSLTPGDTTGTGIVFTAGAPIFALEDVGRVIRSGSAKATITQFNSATEVECTINIDFPDTSTIASGEWTLSNDVVIGLDHLEGQTVTLLVDGAAHEDEVVTNGQVSLNVQGTYVTVGLGYTSEALSLGLEGGGDTGSSQGALSRVTTTRVRVFETVGFEIGFTNDEEEPTEYFDQEFRRPTDTMDNRVPLFSGFKVVKGVYWKGNSTRIAIRKQGALPLTLLGYVVQFEVSPAR